MSNRRNFLKTTLAGSAAISLSGRVPGLLLGASRPNAQQANEKILVVVQLTGGNDGLNTVVPYGDDNYYKNRFTLAIGKNAVRKIDDHIGFHPAMNGFDSLLQDGQLTVVQGVGYPNPNRSHFESMDLWHTAHQVKSDAPIGWLGKTVDSRLQAHDLPALHFGRGVQPLALKTELKPIPSIRSIDNFKLNSLSDSASKQQLAALIKSPRNTNNSLLNYVHESANVALETSHRLENVTQQSGQEFGYPQTDLGRNLGVIAQLIDSGLSTRVYYTTLDGFDTHSNQAESHQGLLGNLSNSVSAFMKQIKTQGNDDRVALFSFSEFGRRVRENASRGTDHGTAAPVFVVGSSVQQAVIGNHPSLAADDLDQGDVKFAMDYRRVYSDLLKNWVGIDPTPIVGGKFEPVGLFG
ncbi:MAG: hypothetical protein ACI87E_001890 [Mariniblastus sp.]|jgi:uncharacterized protein (DUF1501 family)